MNDHAHTSLHCSSSLLSNLGVRLWAKEMLACKADVDMRPNGRLEAPVCGSLEPGGQTGEHMGCVLIAMLSVALAVALSVTVAVIVKYGYD